MLDKFTHLAMPYSFILGMVAGILLSVAAIAITIFVLLKDETQLNESVTEFDF